MPPEPTKPLAEPAKLRPLIPTGVLTEFGEAMEDPEADRIAGVDGRDPTYVPGFSEMRVERDRQLGESARGRHPIGNVKLLPINLRWARRTKISGAPDETKIQKARIAGYEPVTKADVGQAWLTSLPDGAQILADGTIQKGDTILMKCSAQRAASNAYQKQKLTVERLGGSIAKAEDQGIATEAIPGTPIPVGSSLKLPL